MPEQPRRPVTFINVSKSLPADRPDALALKLSYPAFSPLGDSLAERAFVRRVNRFYKLTAERIAAKTASSAKSAPHLAKSCGKMLSVTMETVVAYENAAILSIFTDIGGFDGKKEKKQRFSHFWSAEKQGMLTPRDIFDTSRASRAHVVQCVVEYASKAFASGYFSYRDDYASCLRRAFRFENAYFTPRGVAFFFPAGLFGSDPVAIPVFVVPYERIDGVLKMKF